MANSLLDFVMSLVRDPDVAARYAADPAQTIADAHLTDVTSADVDNLIPVVSESLSMTGAYGGLTGLDADAGGNVWASGAATAAFDAFDDPSHTSDGGWHSPVIDDSGSVSHVSHLPSVDEPSAVVHQELDDLSLQFHEPVVEDVPAGAPDSGLDWPAPIADDAHHADDAGGFDIFD